MKGGACRTPVIWRVVHINVVIPEASELSIQLLPFTMINNLAIFVFKESQDTTFLSFGTPVILQVGITLAVTVSRISIVKFDYRKLSFVILSPLPVLYLWIVSLFEGYSWGFGDRLAVSSSDIGI